MLEFQASQNYMNSGLWYIFIINFVADNPEIFFTVYLVILVFSRKKSLI